MKDQTFTTDVTGDTQEACEAEALQQAHEVSFGGDQELEIVRFSARRIPNPDRRAGDSKTHVLAAEVQIKVKAKRRSARVFTIS